ncbi:MAG: type II toxin-antitoxin system CcdA family antitoxin [Desulfuromonadaceae bacterium]
MNLDLHRTKLQKKSANLSISIDLLQIAKEDNLNLSKMLEESLQLYKKKKQEKEWIDKNKKAFDDYNRMINENGLYSDERRLF